MSEIDETVIILSGRNVLHVIFAAIFIVLLGVWAFSLDAEFILSFRRLNSPLFIHSFGAISALFGGLCGLYAIYRLYGDRRGLAFGSTGIVGYINSVGFIPWHEIEGAKIINIHRQRVLAINLKEPEKFLKRQGWFKRALLSMNQGLCGTPVAISISPLKASPTELLACFDRYKQKYGNVQPVVREGLAQKRASPST